MTEDPWSKIPHAPAAGNIMAVRADPGCKWDFYWARDVNGRRVWAMSVSPDTFHGRQLPGLRGVAVTLAPPVDNGPAHLLLTLKDQGAADIFQRLCFDVMAVAQRAETEAEAAELVVARTWRWHHLMRGAPTQALTDSEQKGLIGELAFLDRHLIPAVGAAVAVGHWFGPLDGPKDFELSHIAVEVKARRGGAIPEVAISSEYQLDRSSFEFLYLAIFAVDHALDDDGAARTLHEWVAHLRADVRDSAPWALELLEARVAAAGYRDEDDYAKKWLVGTMSLFEVQDEFPAITPKLLPAGLHRVTYRVGLAEIQPFLVETPRLIRQLEAAHG